MAYQLSDTIRYLAKRAKVIARERIGNQVRSLVRRKLSLQMTDEFPDVCRLLEGMPVQMFVFGGIKVGFQMHFTEVYKTVSHRYAYDLTEVARTVDWLEG